MHDQAVNNLKETDDKTPSSKRCLIVTYCKIRTCLESAYLCRCMYKCVCLWIHKT